MDARVLAAYYEKLKAAGPAGKSGLGRKRVMPHSTESTPAETQKEAPKPGTIGFAKRMVGGT